MRGKKAKQIRKILRERELHFLVFINKICGERTHDMSERGVYQTAKKLYNQGYISINKDGSWKENKTS